MNKYSAETRERWGDTSAYREHQEKTKHYTKEKWTEANDALMAIFAEFVTKRLYKRMRKATIIKSPI